MAALAPCRAVPIVDITTNLNAGVLVDDITAGYSFTVLRTIQVNALGFYDWDGDGLNMAHSVGLWNSSGTLLASALVDSASRLEDLFRYTDVAPILLGPGTYTLGATSGDGSDWVKYGGAVTSLTTIPEITSTFEPLYALGASLNRPTLTGYTVAPGIFGPNLDVTVEVPELDPSGAPLPLFAALALLTTRRRPRTSTIT
jgi:hypothetical protein